MKDHKFDSFISTKSAANDNKSVIVCQDQYVFGNNFYSSKYKWKRLTTITHYTPAEYEYNNDDSIDRTQITNSSIYDKLMHIFKNK